MKTKNCNFCKQSKTIDNFTKNKNYKDGLFSTCRDCKNKRYHYWIENCGGRERRSFYEEKRRNKEDKKVYMRNWVREKRKTKCRKIYARNLLWNRILRGKIKKQSCMVCGEKAQAHHHDYSKPYDVEWLCLKHHREAHKKEKAVL